MVYHETESIDHYAISDCKYREDRVIYQIILHFIEDVKTRHGSLVSVVDFSVDKFPSPHTPCVIKVLEYK